MLNHNIINEILKDITPIMEPEAYLKKCFHSPSSNEYFEGIDFGGVIVNDYNLVIGI